MKFDEKKYAIAKAKAEAKNIRNFMVATANELYKLKRESGKAIFASMPKKTKETIDKLLKSAYDDLLAVATQIEDTFWQK